MKTPIRLLALLTVTATLPLAVTAQSAQNPASKSASPSSATRSSTSGSTSPSSSSAAQSRSPSASATTSVRSSSSSLSKIQRITEDAIKSQVTAKDLMGEAIYDNAGERIGTVENIILTSIVGQSELARAFISRESSSSSEALTPTGRVDANQSASVSGSAAVRSSTSSASEASGGREARTVLGAAGTTGVNAPTTGHGGLPPAGSDAPGSKGAGGVYGAEAKPEVSSSASTSQSQRSTTVVASNSASRPSSSAAVSGSVSTSPRSSMSASMQADSDAAVVISTGGFLGVGSDMLRVPMSELSYDSANDRIVLNVSQQDLESLTASGSSQSSSAN